MSKEQTPIEMGDCIETKEVRVLIQANGIIRNTKGRFLARLDNEIDFDGEHIFEDDCKAKVLEALEPQKELIEELLTIFDGNGVPNIRYVTELINAYNETEVKPKYE